jgi:hypothetical protein
MLARSIASYAPNGIVAMLLPQSVQLADPGGNAFRRSFLRPDAGDRALAAEPTDISFRVVAADDFAAVNPFAPDASNLTIALYIEPSATATFPIPMHIWTRVPHSRLRADWGWGAARERLLVADTSIEPVDAADITSPWGLSPQDGALSLCPASTEAAYSLGRGCETRGLDGLFTFLVLTPRPTGASQEVRIRNVPDAGDNTRGEDPREGVVEAALLWPLVKGQEVPALGSVSTTLGRSVCGAIDVPGRH